MTPCGTVPVLSALLLGGTKRTYIGRCLIAPLPLDPPLDDPAVWWLQPGVVEQCGHFGVFACRQRASLLFKGNALCQCTLSHLSAQSVLCAHW